MPINSANFDLETWCLSRPTMHYQIINDQFTYWKQQLSNPQLNFELVLGNARYFQWLTQISFANQLMVQLNQQLSQFYQMVSFQNQRPHITTQQLTNITNQVQAGFFDWYQTFNRPLTQQNIDLIQIANGLRNAIFHTDLVKTLSSAKQSAQLFQDFSYVWYAWRQVFNQDIMTWLQDNNLNQTFFKEYFGITIPRKQRLLVTFNFNEHLLPLSFLNTVNDLINDLNLKLTLRYQKQLNQNQVTMKRYLTTIIMLIEHNLIKPDVAISLYSQLRPSTSPNQTYTYENNCYEFGSQLILNPKRHILTQFKQLI